MTMEEIFKTMQDLIAEQFDEEDLAGLKTVGDCVRYLNSKLG